MTLRARDRLVKLLRKRGLRINDTITTALDSFLIEVREQQAARGAGIEDDESEDDETDDIEADDEDAQADEDGIDDEDEEEDAADEEDEKQEADVTAAVGTPGWDAGDDDGGTATPKSKAAKGGKKPPKVVEPEEEALEEERTLVQEVTCPHCGERIPLILDLSGGDQDDIQDCEVCCSPIRVTYTVSQGALGAFSIEAS